LNPLHGKVVLPRLLSRTLKLAQYHLLAYQMIPPSNLYLAKCQNSNLYLTIKYYVFKHYYFIRAIIIAVAILIAITTFGSHL